MRMRFRYYFDAFRDLFYSFLYLIATFIFGWTYEKFQQTAKFYVKLKENVAHVYQRQIYKELRFFHS